MTPTSFTISYDSAIGELLLTSDGEALTGIWLPPSDGRPVIDIRDAPDILVETARQLDGYFAGDRTHFELPLRARGTEFQQQVWSELVRIPYGTTTSYGEIARRMGHPNGARAVGQANGRNPIPIVVPCHRVVASNGLGGYAGGLAMKTRLLALEGCAFA